MKKWLKTDLHLHCSSDPLDTYIITSAEQFVRRAAKLEFDAIAITNHHYFHQDDKLDDLAEQLGVVLIHGVEASIGGAHVLVLNCDRDAEKIRSAADLAVYRRHHPEALIVAPHPFYPDFTSCLLGKLIRHHELFDAVEWCHFHTRYFNIFNRWAASFAQKYGKPILATSDAHGLRHFGRHHARVKSEKNISSIIEAIKSGRVQNPSNPMSSGQFISHAIGSIKARANRAKPLRRAKMRKNQPKNTDI